MLVHWGCDLKECPRIHGKTTHAHGEKSTQKEKGSAHSGRRGGDFKMMFCNGNIPYDRGAVQVHAEIGR